MATLFNTKIKDTYQSLLKLEDNTILTTTSKNITDGLGNASPLYMSTTRIGIGTSSPTSTFEVNGVTKLGQLTFTNQIIANTVATSITINSTSAIDLTSSLGARFFAGYLSGAFLSTTSGFFVGNEVPSAISARLQVKGSGSTSATTSFLVQNSLGNNVFSIKDDENTLIGSGTNGGYKLDVNGTSNIRGSLRMGEPSVAGLVRSHPSVAMNFGGGAGDNVFTFTQINQGAFQSSSANQSLIRASINQGELGTTNYGSVFLSVGTLTNSGGTPIYNSFESRQTINCSGGTTIYRGFYHNPTLTLTTGVTHRAIETTTGDVLFGTTSGRVGIGITPDKLLTVGSPNYGGWVNGEPTIKFNKDLGVLGSLSIAGDSSVLYLWRSGAPTNGSTISSNYDGSGGSLRLGVVGRTDVNIMQNNGDVTIGNNITTLSAKLGVKGSGSTSATTSLLVQNSSGLTALSITDDRTVSIGTLSVSGLTTTGVSSLTGQTNITGLSSIWQCQYAATGTVKPLSFSMQSGSFSANNSAIQFGFNYRASGGLFSQDIFQNILYDNTAGSVVTGFEWFTHQTQVGDASSQLALSLRGKTLSVGTNTPSASAILQADSTTQGVLFPRMTTAQKLAIASPVGGLQVFDTTLNQMSYYNGTAWINF
jgi:hypothetical protein